MNSKIPALYKKYFVDKEDERLGLFRLLNEKFSIESGLYPGSFVHITPSFVIPHMVYVDTDKRCESFFNSEETKRFIDANKEYAKATICSFHNADFSKDFQEEIGSFDLLISLYAGFVSKYCGKYLKKGGILLANNSHGDAPLVNMDERFDFVGVVKRSDDRFSYSEDALDSYFIPKGTKQFDTETIEKTMRGPVYSKTAYAYVFRKREQERG
jgi:hypothetical protein